MSKECPLDNESCDYSDKEVLRFAKKEKELPDECPMAIYCDSFHDRMDQLLKEEPVISLEAVGRTKKLKETIDNFRALGTFG